MNHGLALFVCLSMGSTAFADTSVKNGQDALNSGAMLNMMMGGMLMSSCMSSQKPNMLICLLGGMALMQGMQQSQAASALSNTTAAPTPTAAAQIAASAPAVLPAAQTSAPTMITRGMASLNSAGYRISSDGVTSPSGKFVPSSRLNSDEGLSDLGFNADEISSAKSTVDKLK